MRFRYIACTLGFLLSVSVVHAGTGPPPFTNGSPLETGINGSYVAIASSTNVTGVVSFEISKGIQVGTVAGNQWTFFVDGQILSGSDTVAVSQNNITGILNGGTTDLVATGVDTSITGGTSSSSSTISLPAVFLISGDASAGEFNAKLDLNSPDGFFQGSGRIQGAPGRIDQIITISVLGDIVTATPVVIPASSLGLFGFTIRGTRNSTQAVENGSSSPSP